MSWEENFLDPTTLEGVTFLYALDTEEQLGLGLADPVSNDDEDDLGIDPLGDDY